MEKYADKPMDFADASLVIAAQVLETQRIFTVDRKDFSAYRITSGHAYQHFDLIN